MTSRWLSAAIASLYSNDHDIAAPSGGQATKAKIKGQAASAKRKSGGIGAAGGS